MTAELTALRARIDALDRELTALLEQRMDVAADIAAWKRQAGAPILDAAREAEKLAAVRARCRPETSEAIARVFEAVMAASRAYQAAWMEARDD